MRCSRVVIGLSGGQLRFWRCLKYRLLASVTSSSSGQDSPYNYRSCHFGSLALATVASEGKSLMDKVTAASETKAIVDKAYPYYLKQENLDGIY